MAPTGQQAHASKTKQLTTGKQPKARVQRYLKSTESQLVEKSARNALLMKGIKCSDAMTTILRDMRSMKSPHSKLLQKNNDVSAFTEEGTNSLEFLTTKNDASLFCVASTNKKRPNNLIMGRTYDRRVLDMAELGVLYYKSIQNYARAPKKRTASKPMLHFAGDKWQTDKDMHRLQNLLVDFYRGEPVQKMILQGLDHVISFTATNDTELPSDNDLHHHHNTNNGPIGNKTVVHMRTHFCKLKRHPDGTSTTPVPFLVPCGPDMDFVVKRTQFAAPDMWRAAVKQPKEARAKKVKNHKTNIFGETIGRLHLETQNIDKMGGKKSKALRVADKMEKEAEKQMLEADLEREKGGEKDEFKQTFGFPEVD